MRTSRRSLPVRLATAVMRRFEATPPDPTAAVSGLNEVFRHPIFTEGSEAERRRIMLASAQSVYEDERRNPWDDYFGRDLTPLLVGKHALDLGCFTGGRAVAWSQRYGLASITGIDTEDVFIEAAGQFAERHEIEASFAVGRGEQLPFADETFDAILSFDVLEHVQDPARVLMECRRVLRHGGLALLVFPSFFQPIEHHLSLVTTAPFIHYVFTPRVLLTAYRGLLERRGEAAVWYAREKPDLQSWERGHTINGLTIRRFRRLAGEAGLTIEDQARKPLGSVGRRARERAAVKAIALALRPLARLPLLEEAALHRGAFVVRKP